MFDVNGLTKMLAGKDLAFIQSYAAQHKNDPLVVATALHVANMKKEMDLAKAGQAGAQPMPTVVDQDIAAITPQAPAPAMGAAQLPEDTGIAQLPADNIQGMAGGGIVAFEEGGQVPRYQNQGFVKYPYGMAGTQTNDLYSIPGLVTGQPFLGANNPDLAARIAEIESMARASRSTKDQLIADAKQKAGLAATQSPLTTPTTLPAKGSPKLPDSTVVPAATSAAALAGATDTQTPPDDKTGAGINKNLPSGQGVGFGASPMQSIGKWYESQIPEKEVGQTEEDYLKKRQAVWEPVNTKLTDMIESEKSKLKSDKEENIYMALIQGGLAAAGGSSQYALQNIAQGFGQGAKIYGEGLKDLRQAAKEINKMDMDQQKAIAAQKIGDMDAYEKYSDKVADRNAKIDQLRTSGLGAIASATVSGEYSLAGHRESASAYRDNARAYKEAQTEQRDIGLVEQMRKNIDASLKEDPAFKLDADKRLLEVNRRLQDTLKNYPRLLPYAGLSSIGGGGGMNLTASQQALLKKYGT